MHEHPTDAAVIDYANLIADEIQRPEIRNARTGAGILAACSMALDDFRYDCYGTLQLIQTAAHNLNQRNRLPSNDDFAFNQIADRIVAQAKEMTTHPNPDERFPFPETLEDIARHKATASVFSVMFKDHIVRPALAA